MRLLVTHNKITAEVNVQFFREFFVKTCNVSAIGPARASCGDVPCGGGFSALIVG